MGMSPSYPLVKEPESYEDPDFDEESDNKMELAREIHEINLRFTYSMTQHRIRSIKETDTFEKYNYDWNASVMDLKLKFRHWTSEDLLHLRRLFELFDSNGDRLLDFNEFNSALDLINDKSSPRHRQELFKNADIDHYNSINFEEFLQLMSDLKLGVPKPPDRTGRKDTATDDIISEVARMDTFQQMCYGVF